MARPVVNGQIFHTGSTLQGPVSSTIDKNTPDFVKIEGKSILLQGDVIDTPSHWYATSEFGDKLFHSHPNQVIDAPVISPFPYWKIEGNEVVLLTGSESTPEVTTVDGPGQTFVNVNA